MALKISIGLGDVLNYAVDAILVSTRLTIKEHKGMVEKSMLKRANQELAANIDEKKPMKYGEAILNLSYGIAPRYVISVTPPFWRSGRRNEIELLAQCYREAMRIAGEFGLNRLAIPSIGTGLHGFPVELTSQIALTTICEQAERNSAIEEVVFVCLENNAIMAYQAALKRFAIN